MKEKQTIHRICPCHQYDIEGIQSWLEDMAKDGWTLEQGGYGLGTFTFRRSNPTRCKYRLEVVFAGRKYPDRSNYLEMLKDFGWTHVTDFQGFEIFRTDDLNAVEISTDPVVQAMTLKKLKRNAMNRVVFLLIYGFFLLINKRLSWMYFFRMAVTFGPLTVGLWMVFLSLALILPLNDLRHIHILEKKLRSGQLLHNPKAWKTHASTRKILRIIPLTVSICMLIAWLGGIVMALDRDPISSAIDPPFATIADLADSDYELADYPIGDGNYYVNWSNPIAPTNYEWREYAKFSKDSVGNTGLLIVSYHETASEWLAKGLADDYYTYEINKNRNRSDLEAPNYGLDDVRVFGEFGNYDVLLRHGTIVVYASFSQWNGGDIPDWQVWLESMAEQLLAAA